VESHDNLSDSNINQPGADTASDPASGELATLSPAYVRQHSASRRAFLRRAVIGSATVAAAGSATGVALASGSPAPRILKELIGVAEAASGEKFTTCFTDTSYVAETTFQAVNDQGHSPSAFMWFTAHNLPAGPTYTFSVSQTLGDTSTPFELQSGGMGNNFFLFKLAKDQASDCPTAQPSGQVDQGHLVTDISYSFSGAASDLQLKIHVTWNGGNTGKGITEDAKYTITIFSNGSFLDSENIKVTAIGK